ncbi:MAG: hypothetical protein CMF50_00790 [Legionellales bacterium]|nr:hypothetical protein [Legionellales bacterium]|tara:strand:+ start:49625 stop:50263 length:639 start_codon:yes stop_codon:yes gene_type:complete
MSKPSAKDIDALLPQTQCGDCTYSGCMPYAKAIAEEGDSIDRCLPGGVKTLKALAALTGQAAEPYLDEMANKQKPHQVVAIREAECIGCTKCIQACPVDAIAGAAKLMHTVIEDECTGCELCIEPCPMDCIDIIAINHEPTDEERQTAADKARTRYYYHQYRLERNEREDKQRHQTAKLAKTEIKAADTAHARKAYIEAARQRARAKKDSHE